MFDSQGPGRLGQRHSHRDACRAAAADRSSSVLRIRRSTPDGSRSSCSQIRITAHPLPFSDFETRRSLASLPAILADQKASLDLGRTECSGHPCQKHPSTKMATFSFLNTKSGRTLVHRARPPTAGRIPIVMGRCRRQPFSCAPRSRLASRSSVLRLRRPRMPAMRRERTSRVTMSAIACDQPPSSMRSNRRLKTLERTARSSGHAIFSTCRRNSCTVKSGVPPPDATARMELSSTVRELPLCPDG